ncbi:type 1 fimbrial protein [Cronobacter sakazakii]|nr:type 1 fimbrial protein [Cronobacter sakazakii]ELY4029901.1 type 1 fimbrial protein [Cronobacter sakazakii]
MKKLLLLIMFALGAHRALADDINLQVNGAIIASACDVESASKNKTVDMGIATADAFSQPSTYGPWVPFELSVMNCPVATMAVDATFSGELDPTNSTAYRSTGTGKGLALQLVDGKNNMYMLPGGDKYTETVDEATHSATFQLRARYVRTTEPLVPGTFESAVQVTFTYR